MNILITGGTGFIGKNLIGYLLSKKINKLIIITNKINNSFLDSLNIKKILIFKKNEFNKKKIKIDLVIFLSSPNNNIYSKSEYDKNILFLKNLITYIAKQKIIKFIFLSSGGVYGINKVRKKLKDNITLNKANTLYGNHKLECEKLLKNYSLKLEFNYLIMRVFSVYGPYMNFDDFLIGNIIRDINLKKKLVIKSNKLIYRNYIYVNDLCKLIFKSIDNLQANNLIMNVGNFNIRNDKLIKLFLKLHDYKYYDKLIFNPILFDFNIPNLKKQNSLFKLKFTDINKSLNSTINWHETNILNNI